jgi:hypothetical protein
MESRSTNSMMVFLIVVLFGVAIFGTVRYIQFSQELSDNPWQNYKADVIARAHSGVLDARKIWKDNHVPHYRLVIDRVASGGEPTCQQDVEIIDEKVATTYSDTCATLSIGFGPDSADWKQPAEPFEPTVYGLFDLAEHDTSELFWSGQGVGCMFYLLEVQYDRQLGYPTRLDYRAQTAPSQIGFPVKAEYFREGEATPVAACPDVEVEDGPVITAKITPMQ